MKTGKRKNTAVKWIIGILVAAVAAVLIFILSIFAIDPMFHYHAPLKFLSYPLVNERYQNNGIVKHFDYDSIITGTSMTENFKTSEAQKLFGSDFIKVAFSGGGYTEIGDNLKAAYDSGHDIKYVIWGLDYDKMIYGKNYRYTEKGDFPDYLYNDSSLDDIKYFFDPVVVKLAGSVVKSTVTGRAATSFDVYENWSAGYEYGRDEVIKSCELNASASKMQQLTDADRAVVTENLNENVISIVKAHPETTFYFFYPPYSIAHWGMEINNGQLDRKLGYSVGSLFSLSGQLRGSWHFNSIPLYQRRKSADPDGGHGMIFTANDGRLLMAIHSPNSGSPAHPVFIEMVEKDGTLVKKDKFSSHAQASQKIDQFFWRAVEWFKIMLFPKMPLD